MNMTQSKAANRILSAAHAHMAGTMHKWDFWGVVEKEHKARRLGAGSYQEIAALLQDAGYADDMDLSNTKRSAFLYGLVQMRCNDMRRM